MIWAELIHLGRNGWAEKSAADHVRFDERLWNDVSVELQANGANTVVFSLGEALKYPSHPELAVKGSWEPEKMRAEIARLKGMGFDVVPKLNFSTTHDLWLGEYQRMVSTPRYYRVCEEIIKDVIEIFDHPKLFHLGFDEEILLYQRNYEYCVLRTGDLWWHDILWFIDTVERQGVQAWIWSGEKQDLGEFCRRMPRSVVQSPWLYMGFRDPKYVKDTKVYEQLADAGYDVIPCGSNCYGVYDNFEQNVAYVKGRFDPKHVKGFVNTPWLEVTEGIGTSLYYEKQFDRRKRLISGAAELGRGRRLWEGKNI